MGEAQNSFTIHGGSVEYKGHHYMFYHNGNLPGGGGFQRSACVEEFIPNQDGTIPYIPFTSQGVAQLQTVNPYERQEAETINQCSGVICEGDHNQCYVTSISKDDYIKVRGVDFGETGTQTFSIRVRATQRCALTLRIGSKTGAIKGKVNVQPTNGEWQDFECNLTSPIKNVCDIFFTFSGNGSSMMDFDSWQFNEISTEIGQTIQDATPSEPQIYDLSGRRMGNSNYKIQNSKLQQGIYIVKQSSADTNGKKVVIK